MHHHHHHHLNNNNNNYHHHHSAASMYSAAGLHPATAQAMGMLTPQLLAANQTAAAIMAAGLPMSLRATFASATGLFPPHPALFGAWAAATSPNSLGNNNNNNNINTLSPLSATNSPISPALSSKSTKNLKNTNNNNSNQFNNNNNNNSCNNNNNIVVSTTTSECLPQTNKTKKRKQISVKKNLIASPTHPVTIPINHSLISPGPISPPTSGSSPQSTGSIETPIISTSTAVSSGSTKDMSRDKVFTCKICSRSFGYKHVLQNHERTHTGEKPFECPECHKRFTRDHHLKTHMRLHTGEKPYSCSHCDRQFVQVANLRRHLRVHTGEKPYGCDECQSRFSDSNQLKSHMLIHTGEKPFQCDNCHTRYRRRHHLVHHKCGISSPPTPAISPSMSLSDHKSEASDESMELGKTLLHNHNHSIKSFPLGLTEDSHDMMFGGGGNGAEKRNRKSNDIRRVIRMPQQIMQIQTALPEQTEPEDLSMHSPRSPVSLDELEELEDAATLYMKQQQQKRLHHMET